MDEIVEYASIMIDITGAMLDHRDGLNDDQAEYVGIMHARSLDFVGAYIDHRQAQVQVLRRYLSHDAISPLATVIGFADLLLMPHDPLPPAYADGVNEVRQAADSARLAVVDLLQQVVDFMLMMDIPH